MRRIKLPFTKLTQAGDTIIEVMIAMSVVSMVLGGAYVTTNRNLQSSRDAEERGSGVKLVESQIEQLKELANTDPDTVFGSITTAAFCVYEGDIVDASSNKCTVNRSGTAATAEPLYTLSTVRTDNTFTAKATWTKAGGDGTNNVQIVYKLHD